MLYLFNASVIEISGLGALPPDVVRSVAGLGLEGVLGMVADAMRSDPTLGRSNPVKARRAAQMLLLRAPQMNAALVTPSRDGQPGEARLMSIGLDLMRDLYQRQREGELDLDLVRRLVWSAAPA